MSNPWDGGSVGIELKGLPLKARNAGEDEETWERRGECIILLENA